MITGFIVANICMVLIILGFVFPRYYEVFIPPHRRHEGSGPTIAMEPKLEIESRPGGHDLDGDAGYVHGSAEEKDLQHDSTLVQP